MGNNAYRNRGVGVLGEWLVIVYGYGIGCSAVDLDLRGTHTQTATLSDRQTGTHTFTPHTHGTCWPTSRLLPWV